MHARKIAENCKIWTSIYKQVYLLSLCMILTEMPINLDLMSNSNFKYYSQSACLRFVSPCLYVLNYWIEHELQVQK